MSLRLADQNQFDCICLGIYMWICIQIVRYNLCSSRHAFSVIIGLLGWLEVRWPMRCVFGGILASTTAIRGQLGSPRHSDI